MKTATESQVKNAPVLWHSMPLDEILADLETSESGLANEEAQRRLQTLGPNRLPPPHKRNAVFRFIQQFHNLLIYILLAAGIITLIIGHFIDSSVIFGVVLVNAVIGFIQEGKAERALDAISGMLSHNAKVMRDGQYITLDAEQVVPGDIILVQSGDKVPADCRLIQSREVRIDESMLTGESLPSEKGVAQCDADALPGDRLCMAYSGTLVTYGSAKAVIVETGSSTEIGQISELLEKVTVLETPLLRRINQLALTLTVIILLMTSLTFMFGILYREYSITDMFLAGVGLAVAAIPEGLPAIITITLAIGVQAMARRQAIIRRLPAVETLGSITTICTDKTGTLTCNEMTVDTITLGEKRYQVSGAGYGPTGNITLAGQEVFIEDHPLLRELAHAAMLCNDARLTLDQDMWTLHGDPTEGALITLAMKAGLDFDLEHRLRPRVDAIPFESEHRFMATLNHDHEGRYFMYLKGAPEKILEICSTQRMNGTDKPIDIDYWEQQMSDMAGEGQRVLAIACKCIQQPQQSLNFEDTREGVTLLGLVGMIDPPRDQVIDSITACRNAGIRVRMITGDHATTAKAIGKKLGIGNGQSVLTGVEIDNMSDDELQKVINEIEVFARTSPQQKLKLVNSLQQQGQVVAMTGDGVNDAPALKQADVGVAMGRKGTSVAKEASEMVLVDDNFSSIVNAIEEGRTIYDNIKKSILFILPTNGGEAFTILAAVLFGRELPITPVQILWVNMITAVTLALALAFEPTEKNVMHRQPRPPSEALLSYFLFWRVIFVSLILVSGTFGLFILARESGASIEYARTVALNMLVVFEIFYLFNSRYINDSSVKLEAFTGNRYVLYAIAILVFFQALITYAPPMQKLFGTEAISAEDWYYILLTGCLVYLLVELEKGVTRLRYRR